MTDVKDAEGSSFELSLEDGVVSKFVLLAVSLFALEGDGGVWDRVARGLLVLDADDLVGLPLESLKFSVSFTLRLLA